VQGEVIKLTVVKTDSGNKVYMHGITGGQRKEGKATFGSNSDPHSQAGIILADYNCTY